MCDQQTANNKAQKSCAIKPKDEFILTKQFPKFRIENNVLIGEELPISREPINLSGKILDILRSNPDCIGQIDVFTDRRYTFADIEERSIKCALWLKKQGVKPGDLIGLCTDNNMDATVIFLGITYLGAICNTWDHELSLHSAKHFLSFTSPAIVFALSISAKNLTEAAKELNTYVKVVTIDKLNGYDSFDDIINGHDTREVAEFKYTPVSSPDEIVLIVLSSGTTGMPKATELSHSSLYNCTISQTCTSMRGHICTWTPTMRWQYGVMLACNALSACVTRVIIPDCVSDDYSTQIYDYIEKYKVTWFATDACILIHMIKTDAVKKYKLPNLKKLITCGAHFRKHYQEALAKMLPHVLIINGYGATDLGFNGSVQNEYSKPGSVGFITPCHQLEIRDIKSGKVLGPNQTGEIFFKGPSVMIRYYKNPEATKAAFDSKGWLRIGDVGYYDDDGEIYLVDRISEFILFRSINVSPAEIEDVLMHHPAVDKAAVIGVHHEVDEQQPMGIVTLLPGKTVTEQELMDLVAKNLPDYCRLRAGVKFINEMPRSSTGKIVRKKLKEMFA